MDQEVEYALHSVALNLENLLRRVHVDHALPQRLPDQNLLDHHIVLLRNVEPLANLLFR